MAAERFKAIKDMDEGVIECVHAADVDALEAREALLQRRCNLFAQLGGAELAARVDAGIAAKDGACDHEWEFQEGMQDPIRFVTINRDRCAKCGLIEDHAAPGLRFHTGEPR